MIEYHGKKFNLVACNIKQVKDWETQDELKAALKSFFIVCGIDIASFTITAIHRLQTKSGLKPLPLIFKLQNLDDVYRILHKDVFKKLKAHNEKNDG